MLIELRKPTAEDAVPVFDLIAATPALDDNSLYCNLLQCSHFADTSVVALVDGQVVGFASGHRPPQHADTLFIWQVVVSDSMRGKGLAADMVMSILEREDCKDVSYLEATITETNQASWGLFESLAKRLDAGLQKSVFFDKEAHFANRHDSEILAHIGPFRHQDVAP